MSFLNPFRIAARRKEEEKQRARIALVADAGDVRSLVELLPFLPPEAHRLGPEAASAAASVLGRCSPIDLASFDQWYRGSWLPKGPPAPAWKDIRLGSSSWARQFRGVVALASFHTNGFVREVAVRLLSEFDDGLELPFLLIRSNDWVPKVRVAAATAVSKRVVAGYTERWFSSLVLLERLRVSKRGEQDRAPFARRVDDLLRQDHARASLESALSSGPLATRRAALRLVLGLPRDDRFRLLANAARDIDPSLAFDAAKALLQSEAPHGSATFLPQLLQHRLGAVRNLALLAAVEEGLSSAKEWLERGVFDEASCVRETARHELGKQEPRDFAALYRARLSSTTGRDQVVALQGLAEVGTRDDAEHFVLFLGHSNPRMRAAAIGGLGRCAGEAHLDALETALRDRSSTVRNTATRYAKSYLGRSFVQRIRQELREKSGR